MSGESSRCKFCTNEGIANQFGFESCADSREGMGEALTGARLGQPLNSEIITRRSKGQALAMASDRAARRRTSG
jgi:hypothetical protein